jgi:hypothetical protein
LVAEPPSEIRAPLIVAPVEPTADGPAGLAAPPVLLQAAHPKAAARMARQKTLSVGTESP